MGMGGLGGDYLDHGLHDRMRCMSAVLALSIRFGSASALCMHTRDNNTERVIKMVTIKVSSLLVADASIRSNGWATVWYWRRGQVCKPHLVEFQVDSSVGHEDVRHCDAYEKSASFEQQVKRRVRHALQDEFNMDTTPRRRLIKVEHRSRKAPSLGSIGNLGIL